MSPANPGGAARAAFGPRGRLLCFLGIGGYAAAMLAVLLVAAKPAPFTAQLTVLTGTGKLFIDGMTAFLLYLRFREEGRHPLHLLGAAYLFSVVAGFALLLTYPGAILPSGPVIGGGTAAPWIDLDWRLGFSGLVLAAVACDLAFEWPSVPPDRIGRVFRISLALLGLLSAIGFILPVAGEAWLPSPVRDGRWTLWDDGGCAVAVAFGSAAIELIRRKPRGRGVFYWSVAATALVFCGGALAHVAGGGPDSLGNSAARLDGVLSASILFILLMRDSARLHRQAGLQIAELRESTTRLERVLETAGEGIYGLDAAGKVIFANRAAAAFLGWPDRAAVIGKPGPVAVGHTLADGRPCGEGECRIVKTLADGQSRRVTGEYFRRGDGTLVPVEYVVSAHVIDGTVVGAVVVFGDASRHREAELASRAKSEFLANMSHEIRTPLNAVMTLAKILQDSAIPRREKGFVSQIEMAARSLLGILNDILDFSKIEAGRLELEHTVFSLAEVLRNVATFMTMDPNAKAIEIVFDVAPEIPPLLLGDPLRLQQVLTNLAGNAMKFTASGEVVVTTALTGADASGFHIEFAVRDTGIGIAADRQERLFQAFSQVESSTSRKYGGTGLGLAICSRLVGLMGGRIGFRSDCGKGSDFRFTVILGRPPASESAGIPAAASEPRHVLFVDDNAAAREALCHAAAALGWRAEAAASGHECLERLRRRGRGDSPADFLPDLLVIDCAMPGMNGFELAREAAADPAVSLPPFLLMVPPDADDPASLEHKLLTLPFRGFLPKPVLSSTLRDAVLRAEAGEVVSKPEGGLSRNPLAGLRLLLVEDNEVNRKIARILLEKAGATVEVAEEARAAVSTLRKDGSGFDAVLMDVQMPELNGYEATRMIRNELGLASLPIIALTATMLDGDRERACMAGMNAYISKPIDLDELIQTLLVHVKAGRTADGQDAEQADPEAPSGPSRRSVRSSTRDAFRAVEAGEEGDPFRLVFGLPLSGIELAQALDRLSGDRLLLLTLLRKFRETYAGTAAEVRRLWEMGDTVDAARALHALAGVAGNLGAVAVSHLASKGEAAIRRNRVAAVPELLGELERALTEFHAAIGDIREDDAARQGGPIRPADGALRTDLEQLLTLVRTNNLRAVDMFALQRTEIEAGLGRDACSALAGEIDTLDFHAAERRLVSMTEKLHRPEKR